MVRRRVAVTLQRRLILDHDHVRRDGGVQHRCKYLLPEQLRRPEIPTTTRYEIFINGSLRLSYQNN